MCYRKLIIQTLAPLFLVLLSSSDASSTATPTFSINTETRRRTATFVSSFNHDSNLMACYNNKRRRRKENSCLRKIVVEPFFSSSLLHRQTLYNGLSISDCITNSSSVSNVKHHHFQKKNQHHRKNHLRHDNKKKNYDSNLFHTPTSFIISAIKECKSTYELSKLIREYPHQIFDSTEADEVAMTMVERDHPIVTLKSTVQRLSSFMTPRDVSGLLNVLSKRRVSSSSVRKHLHEIMSCLTDRAIALLQKIEAKSDKNRYNVMRFESRDLSMTVNAIAKAKKLPNHSKKILFFHIAQTAIPILHQFSAQGLANTMNAYVKTLHMDVIMDYNKVCGGYYRDLILKISIESMKRIDEFNAQELSILANAYGKLSSYSSSSSICYFDSKSLFEKIAQASLPKLSQFTSQGLANLINAFAKSNNKHNELLEKVAIVGIDKLQYFTTQELTMTVHAYAKLNYYQDCDNNDCFVDCLLNAIADRSMDMIPQFQIQELSTIAYSYVHLGPKQQRRDLLNAVARDSILRIKEISARGLSVLANSFCKLDQYNMNNNMVNRQHYEGSDDVLKRLFQVIEQSSLQKINEFNGQGLANLLHAYATVNYPDYQSFFQTIADVALVPKLRHQKEEDSFDFFTPQGLVTIVNSYANMNYPHEGLFQSVAAVVLQKSSSSSKDRDRGRDKTSMIEKFDTRGLASLAHSYAQVNYCNEELFNTIAQLSILHFRNDNTNNNSNTFNIAKTLTILIHSYAKINHCHEELFQSVAQNSITNIHLFNGRGLSMTAGAYAKVHHVHHALFLRMAEETVKRSEKLFFTKDRMKKQGSSNSGMRYDDYEEDKRPITHSLVNFVHAYAQLGYKVTTTSISPTADDTAAAAAVNQILPKFLKTIATLSISIMDEFDLYGLEILRQSFTDMNYYDPDMFYELSRVSIPIVESSLGSSLSPSPSSLLSS